MERGGTPGSAPSLRRGALLILSRAWQPSLAALVVGVDLTD
jgi:hypothetical protein